MKTSFIEEEVIKTYPKLIQDHLINQKLDLEGWKEQIYNKSANYSLEQRNELVLSLREQYKGHDISPEIRENIEFLKGPNTFTVTTGHQLCLFTGPAYVIIKVLQTIKTCIDLEALFSGCRFVPIFWMASEDHDFEEISKANIFNEKINWDYDNDEHAVGHISINELKPILNKWKELTKNETTAQSINSIFENAIEKSKELSGFFRLLFASLFGKYGLIVFDANNLRSKNSFNSIIKEELNKGFIKTCVEKTIDKFKSSYKVQVNPRSCNLFYFEKGKRYRIEKKKEKLYLVDYVGPKVFDWEKESKSSIDQFSPNVLLRPLYQEYLLPNLAYVGGTSEISYWKQLKHAFNYSDITIPKLIVRNSVFFITPKINKTISKTQFNLKELFKNLEVIKKEMLLSIEDGAYDIENNKNAIQLEVNNVLGLISESDQDVIRSFNADIKSIENVLDKMQKKLIRYKKKKHTDKVNNIDRIYEYFFPNGLWHERVFNFYHFQFNSEEDLFENVLKGIRPFKNGAVMINL